MRVALVLGSSWLGAGAILLVKAAHAQMRWLDAMQMVGQAASVQGAALIMAIFGVMASLTGGLLLAGHERWIRYPRWIAGLSAGYSVLFLLLGGPRYEPAYATLGMALLLLAAVVTLLQLRGRKADGA